LIPYLPVLISGRQAWQQDETIRRAIEIQDGAIDNDKILRFQNRENTYPYVIKQTR
jgi:N5-(carboxyethyl)ornithine synthase